MLHRLRANAVAIVASVIGILVVVWLDFYGYVWSDYDTEARPAFDALIHGHVLRALQVAPAYGGSLILRSPFALLPVSGAEASSPSTERSRCRVWSRPRRSASSSSDSCASPTDRDSVAPCCSPCSWPTH